VGYFELIRFEASDNGERTFEIIISAIVIATAVVNQHIVFAARSRKPFPNDEDVKMMFARRGVDYYDNCY
jgi:hypothetical protein